MLIFKSLVAITVAVLIFGTLALLYGVFFLGYNLDGTKIDKEVDNEKYYEDDEDRKKTSMQQEATSSDNKSNTEFNEDDYI